MSVGGTAFQALAEGAWEFDDAAKAEKLIRNLARRLDQERPGVAAGLLEGLDEILTVVPEVPRTRIIGSQRRSATPSPSIHP